MWEVVVVDGQRDPRVFDESLELWRFWRRAHNEFTAVPVEPNGDHSWSAVHPDVR